MSIESEALFSMRKPIFWFFRYSLWVVSNTIPIELVSSTGVSLQLATIRSNRRGVKYLIVNKTLI